MRGEIAREAVEEIEFLARSPNRVQILARAREREAIEWERLRSEFEVARTTLLRNLDALQERDWLRQTDPRSYEVTQPGEEVVTRFVDLVETVEVTRKLEPFLEWFPDREVDLDLHLFADAEVVVPDESNPYAAVNRHVDAMQSADWFRCLLPAVGLQPMTTARDCVVEDGQEHEVVLDPSVAETLRTDPTYGDVLADLVASDRCTVRVCERAVPFYLGLSDAVVQIGVDDDAGMPRCLLESTSEEVREWAWDTYDRYGEVSEPFPGT